MQDGSSDQKTSRLNELATAVKENPNKQNMEAFMTFLKANEKNLRGKAL